MFSKDNSPKATIQFQVSGLQLRNTPPDLFACDDDVALATFAALCGSPIIKGSEQQYLISMHSLALRQLALFAAGAQVCYHRNDFRDLEDLARGCSNGSNHSLVSWVLKRAYDRAKLLGLIGPGTADGTLEGNAKVAGFAVINPDDGRGFNEVVPGLSEDMFRDKAPTPSLSKEAAHWQVQFERWSPAVVAADDQAWFRKRLITYAAVMAALKPRLCQARTEGVVFLALYGAGVDVQLDAGQYSLMRVRAQDFKHIACRGKVGHNSLIADFVLQAAAARAAIDGIDN